MKTKNKRRASKKVVKRARVGPRLERSLVRDGTRVKDHVSADDITNVGHVLFPIEGDASDTIGAAIETPSLVPPKTQ